jgi:hypothetical protein
MLAVRSCAANDSIPNHRFGSGFRADLFDVIQCGLARIFRGCRDDFVSWTDIYPLLTDEMLDVYQAEATAEEKDKMNEWFSVAEVFNRQQSEHLVVTSIFKDPNQLGKPASEVIEEEADPDGKGWTAWFDFQQLLTGAGALRALKPGVVLRVYLAADRADLVEQLVRAGCEVFLMKGSSPMINPASMWRFLALEEKGRWITFTHGQFGHDMIHDVERTEHVMATSLGFWRAPHVTGDKSIRLEARSYRPIHADHFGAKGGLAARPLMEALVWHCLRGTMPVTCSDEDGSRNYPLEGSEWPTDGFDEWFLLSVLYPRVAFEGVLTFLIWQRKTLSYWYALDIEYVTWANAASEVLVSRKIITTESPWNALPETSGLTIRADTEVFRRKRRIIYEGFELPSLAKEVLPFPPFEGSLTGLLEWAGANVTARWWIDFKQDLKAVPTGAELFLDRRYETADVVVCGHYFFKITEAVAAWAERHGLEPAKWQEGWICKLPKLEGRLTLWRTDFSREFHRALTQEADAPGPELLLTAWMQQGKAVVMSTTAGKMGWKLA